MCMHRTYSGREGEGPCVVGILLLAVDVQICGTLDTNIRQLLTDL